MFQPVQLSHIALHHSVLVLSLEFNSDYEKEIDSDTLS